MNEDKSKENELEQPKQTEIIDEVKDSKDSTESAESVDSKKSKDFAESADSENLDNLILKYSLPAIISNLVASFYNIVDQIFIGNIIGVEGNAATNITYPLIILTTAYTLLIGIGGVSNFSISLGRKDLTSAKKYVGGIIILAPLGGIIITLISLIFTHQILNLCGATPENYDIAYTYLKILALGFPFFITTECLTKIVRADGAPKYAMICSIAGALLNCLLNPIFMIVFDLGIAGAAMATVTCQFVTLCLVLKYFLKFKSFKLNLEIFKIDINIVKRIFMLGTAGAINQIAMMVTQIVMNNTLKAYGDLSIYGSTIPLACVGIITKVNAMYMGVMIGIAQGAQPLFGYNYGAGNYTKVINVYFKCIKFASIFSIITFIAFQTIPREIISLFGSGDELYYQFGVSYFKTFLFMTFLNGAQPITVNFFTAIGKPLKGAIVSLTKQFMFLIPLIYILSSIYGLDGMLYSGPIADTLAFTITMIFVYVEVKHLKEQQLQ